MNKHTDAPWIAEGPAIFSTSSWVQVAEVNDALIFADNNARLIAAAPDLLVALKRCANVCAGESVNKDSLIRALESARAAIAKAEGA